MPVKNKQTQIVHSGSVGGTTKCGFNTNDNPKHWVNTNERITCDKSGCKERKR